ncbi:MAG: cytosine permease [Candidatus Erginobacter occultus]|nr:cytosine permease [Candidatus Erginobacter occultus]
MKRLLHSFIFGDTSRPDPDYPLSPVPSSARRGLVSISVVLLGFTFFYPTMYAGARIGHACRFWPDLFLILGAGSLILGLYVAALCAVSADSGLTTVLLARYAFGRKGARWADLILGGTQLGWFGVTVALMAKPFVDWLGLDWANPATMIFWCLLWSAAFTSTAYFGYKGMEALSLIAVPCILALGAVMAVNSFAYARETVGGITRIVPEGRIGFGAAMTLIVGTFASGGTQAPNWARFARGRRVAFLAGLFAFLIGNGLMLWFGAVGGNVYGEPDFAAVLKLQGLLGLGIILMVLNVWTTNDNTAYAVGVAGTALFNFNRKRPFVLFCGAFGFLIAISGAYDYVSNWMAALGILIPPLGGVILGDYYLVRKRKLPPLKEAQLVNYRPAALAAYILGVLAAYFSERYSFLIPPLNGILVAGLGHTLIQRLFTRGTAGRAPTEAG